MALIYELKLDEEEIETGRRLAKAMLKIYRTGTWSKVEIEFHFTEWKRIAGRIKRGGAMLDNTSPLRQESKEYVEKLESLYTYLMGMLGLYDAFFRYMFQKNEEMYERARQTVFLETK